MTLKNTLLGHIVLQGCLVAIALVSSPSETWAHGYVISPAARQVICADDGGYWAAQDGSQIPNEACRNAFLRSGTYPFVQKNELATLIPAPDYNDLEKVKVKVADGLICSGGDSQKSGLDIPSAAWQKTTLEAGQVVRMELKGTAPHMPSFLQVFLTNPGFNSATDTLSWADLRKIHDQDLHFENGIFSFDVVLPNDAQGSGAILVTRWQRIDPQGEGFYNCSDVSFGTSGNRPVVDAPAQPTASASARPAQIVGSGSVVLAASASVDGSGTLSYRWSQTSGPSVYIEDAYSEYARVELPEENEDQTYEFRVVVSNSAGSDTAVIQVGQSPSEEPAEEVAAPEEMASPEEIGAPEEPAEEVAAADVSNAEYRYPDGIGSYQAGTLVQGSDGNFYQCRGWPYSGWCNGSGTHYAPGTGLNWDQAWTFAAAGEEDPSVNEGLSAYPNNLGSYAAGDRVLGSASDSRVFECKIAAWCNIAAYSPTGIYGSSAWVER